MRKTLLSILGFGFFLVISNSYTEESRLADLESASVATFAGGCFWCMQPPFDKLDGVLKTSVGFSGGKKRNPQYREVASGSTSHIEVVQVLFDPKKITYEKLLDVFWMNIDPTDSGGQFVDRGAQYRPAVFFHNEEQKKLAQKSKAALENSGRFKKPVTTELLAFNEFFPAEDYHQKYYQKSPMSYNFYRFNSGRDDFIEKYWGKKK